MAQFRRLQIYQEDWRRIMDAAQASGLTIRDWLGTQLLLPVGEIIEVEAIDEPSPSLSS